jgi:hypothetical protein
MEKSGNVEEDQLSTMLKYVEKFQKIEKPEIKDLSSLLIPFIKFYVENKRLEKVENYVDELAADVHNLKLDITNDKIQLEALDRKISDGLEELNKTIKSFTEKIDNLELNNKKSMSKINVLVQTNIDNDIIIRGFPGKVESKTICENFIKSFNLDPHQVTSHYYFPYDSKFSGKTSHNIIISFREKQTKMNVLSRKRQMGPLLMSQLLPEESSASKIVTLSYSNRLSKFNLHTIYHLNKAKVAGKIFNIRFHNLCFAVKDTVDSQWCRISNTEELEPYKIYN